jgi:hypothetical protein
MSATTPVPTRIDIQLDIQWDSSNEPHFAYIPKPPLAHADGTLDLSTVAPNVELAIWLISTGGETFASPTIGIVPYHGKRPDPCPVANDVGHGVFHAMRLSPDRRTFMMIDNNQGKAQFFYALWFDKPGMASFAWDPKIINQ